MSKFGDKKSEIEEGSSSSFKSDSSFRSHSGDSEEDKSEDSPVAPYKTLSSSYVKSPNSIKKKISIILNNPSIASSGFGR